MIKLATKFCRQKIRSITKYKEIFDLQKINSRRSRVSLISVKVCMANKNWFGIQPWRQEAKEAVLSSAF